MPKPLAEDAFEVQFGSETISCVLRFSERKSVGISVLPDLSVRVTAPVGSALEAVRGKVKKRAAWILKQQSYFREFLPGQPARRFVSGETHYYLGRQYRLKVIESEKEEEAVKLKGRFIYVWARDKSDRQRIEALLEGWYREHALRQFAKRLAAIWDKMRKYELGERMPPIRLRRMSKRWGSCTAGGLIYLNPNLVKAPALCIEYLLVHELCHLKIPNHSTAFFDLLKRLLPDWEKRKARLEEISSL